MSRERIGARIQQWVRPEIRALHAYHVPPSMGMVKLDAMENPCRWPDSMLDAWQLKLRDAATNR